MEYRVYSNVFSLYTINMIAMISDLISLQPDIGGQKIVHGLDKNLFWIKWGRVPVRGRTLAVGAESDRLGQCLKRNYVERWTQV
jgi:hypothetical protein